MKKAGLAELQGQEMRKKAIRSIARIVMDIASLSCIDNQIIHGKFYTPVR